MNISPNDHGYYPSDSKAVRKVSGCVIGLLVVFAIVGVTVLTTVDMNVEYGSFGDSLAVGFVGMLILTFIHSVTYRLFGKQVKQKYDEAMKQFENGEVKERSHKKFLVGEDAYNKRMSKRRIERETSKWQDYIPPSE